MAAFGTAAYANGVNALADLLNKSVAAGYTPASAVGPTDLLTAVVGSMLADQIPAPAGTAAAPGISTTGDSDTGIWFSAANTVDVGAGGKRAAQFATATNAVNYATVTPAATTANPTLAAAGSDTNISLALSGKGTGGVVINGGNPIGIVRILSATLTPAAVAANTAVEQTFTSFTGLTTADIAVGVQKAAQQGGLVAAAARVVTTNNLGIMFANVTASAITPTAGEVYKVFTMSLGVDD